MIDAVVFPDMPYFEKSHSWNLRASTFLPGQATTGAFPLGRIDGGGLWSAVLNEVHLISDDDLRVYRALRSLAQGGVRAIIVPRHDPTALPPFPTIGGVRVTSYGNVPYSDGSFFSDGTGFYQPVIVAVTVGAAALRASSLTISFISGAALRGGECFSIAHTINNWRLYEITSVTIVGGNSVVTIEPPLREAVPSGTAVEFDRPRCTMRLASPSSMDIDLTTFPYPWPSPSFIEYPWTSP